MRFADENECRVHSMCQFKQISNLKEFNSKSDKTSLICYTLVHDDHRIRTQLALVDAIPHSRTE